MDDTPSMDAIITGLGGMKAEQGRTPEQAGIIQAAVNILFALSEEGIQTADDALAVMQDYHLQAKQLRNLHKKHEVAGRPILKDSVWHCPDCNRRTAPGHSFCHRCGKRLRWD